MNKRDLFAGAMALALLASCEKSDNNGGVAITPPVDGANFTVVWVDESSSVTPSYLQSYDDISDDATTIDFYSKGFKINATRSSYISASNDGDYLYAYDYNGTLTTTKYQVKGGDNFMVTGAINFSTYMNGSTSGGRYSKVNDSYGSAHYMNSWNANNNVYDEQNNFLYYNDAFVLSITDLSTMTIDKYISLNQAPKAAAAHKNAALAAEEAADAGLFPFVGWRMSAPMILGNKIFYGIARDRNSKDDVTSRDTADQAPASLLVLDFPFKDQSVYDAAYEAWEQSGSTDRSLIYGDLVQLWESDVARYGGDTYGYRSPAMIEYDNNLYLLSMDDPYIMKLNESGFDNSYVFDVAAALGNDGGVAARGIWLADATNGIAYVLTNDSNDGWGVARVDLVNKSAVALNVPSNLNLSDYQNIKVKDGQIYLAMCPYYSGESGNIYVFDVADTTGEPAAIGAALKNYADTYYNAIY